MNIPCVNRLPFIVLGLSFLQPALTNAQFNNLTLIATALVLGAKFSLTQINLMWLKERSVSTLSWFMSDAKFSTCNSGNSRQFRQFPNSPNSGDTILHYLFVGDLWGTRFFLSQ
jgi:hypothetical protein